MAMLALKQAPELQKYILRDVKRTGKSLGSGSYGAVEEVEFDHVLCAGKKIHESLIGHRNINASQLVAKFEQECRLLKELRYPHIVQFYGIHFYDDSNAPVLVMELLSMNIEDWLNSHGNREVPLSLKSSILRGIAKGLHHLHTHDPVILHRDLTARNVLLTSSMEAKIADLGNACIVPPQHLIKTMTRGPGTIQYMPPEAQHGHYTEKLDIFSFGHLTLYVMIQEHQEVLPATYVHPKNPNDVIGRSEIERRISYFNVLYQKYAKSHDIPVLIASCLHMVPEKRPSACKIIEVFNGFLVDLKDEYMVFEGMNRFEMAEKLKDNRGLDDSLEINDRQLKINDAKERIKNSSSCPLVLDIRRVRPGRSRNIGWRKYSFCYDLESGNLKFYGDCNRGPKEIANSDKFECVVERQASCEFEIQIKGKGSWILKTSNEEERAAWIEILRPDKPSPEVDFPCTQNAYACDYVRPDTIIQQKQKQLYAELDVQSKDVPQVYHLPSSPQRRLSSSKKQRDVIQEDPDNKTCSSQEGSSNTSPQQPTVNVPSQAPPQPPPKPPLPPQAPPPPPPQIFVEEPEDDKKGQDAVVMRDRDNPPATLEQRRSRTITAEQMDLINEMMPLAIGGGSKHASQPHFLRDDVVRNVYSSQQQPEKSGDGGIYVDMNEIDDIYDTISEDEEGGNTYERIPGGIPRHIPKPVPPPLPPKLVKLKGRPNEKSTSGNTTKKPMMPRVARKPLVKRESSLDQFASASSSITDDMLVTDDTIYNALHRPAWTKAMTDIIQIEECDQEALSMLSLDPKLIRNGVLIGSGNFGNVYKATLETPNGRGVEVAVKCIKEHSTKKERKDFIMEMVTMTTMLHPNIVYLHGLVLEENLIVLEYLPNGDLGTFLKNNPRSVRTLIKYMVDIAMGMHHVSQLGLVHRDLAARNVLVGQNEVCKVADFGLIRKIKAGAYHQTSKSKVPIRWTAPECLLQNKYTTASDVWSYGIVLWEMSNPTLIPYYNYADFLVGAKITDGEKLEPPSQYPDVVQKIMHACWQMQPSQRPSFCYITGLLTRQGLIYK